MSENDGIHIGSVFIPGFFGLAPMAGFADLAFRSVCKDFGCGYTCTEMVSAKALVYGDKKTAEIAQLAPNEGPAAVQIFGSEPEVMAQAAEIALEISGAQILDINMGCPARKIISAGDGSALLKDLNKASQIIRSVKNSIACPLTVKFRTGWDEKHIIAKEFAKMAEDSGADGLCIHGRTTSQHYSGYANPYIMAQAVDAVHIPVMVNGDISCIQDARDLLKITGSDYALVGRGALGTPWIFREKYVPSPQEKMELFLRQARLAAEQKGEERAMKEMRSHFCKYLSGFSGASAFRCRAVEICTLSDAVNIVNDVIETASSAGFSESMPQITEKQVDF